MNKNDLLIMVSDKYMELNIKDGRYTKDNVKYMAPELLEMPSNQIKALIEVIAPLIGKEKG